MGKQGICKQFRRAACMDFALVECSWNVMAHGDSRDGEVKGKQDNGVGNQ